MYIAGLNLPISLSQGVEALVTLTTIDFFRYVMGRMRAVKVSSDEKGGRIRPETMPTSFLGRVISPIHGLATFVPPVAFILGVTLNSFKQPDWMLKMALPDDIVQPEVKTALRLATCVASLAMKIVMDRTFNTLGEQWHVIGRREKPRVVQSGPYAVVRHPMYSSVLFQEILYSVMFWSYAPLVGLSITASAFAIKMPIEEGMIQKDEGVRDEYRAYKKNVPARIIPYIW
ncbi:hypothetical protein HYDPIDRAFT_90192 [Hydnomerulius pinastri MD-312]|uniref:Protein-S-isoprenylcysteine O-methyltransferase n=1 Tax=Hydnomerulius pinastri MD-312 TaxID=994086 RepID=A0A0C9W0W2_9AGAM|nr:hypothetical protein HYDPIDRAFT_90192 [Hydnomerulius pinastri MD-312]